MSSGGSHLKHRIHVEVPLLVVVLTVVSAALCGCGATPALTMGTLLSTPTPTMDTLLSKYFCQLYYPTDHVAEGLPPCADVRAAVVAKPFNKPLPTLELGDPTKPGLLFVHGWPDSAAEFASQFGFFCYGPDAEYHCLAVTWQNFHPDLPDRPESDLRFQKTIDWIAETIIAAKLVDPTLVIHDWGAFLGYQLMAQHPTLMERTIAFDIGTGGTPNVTYQGINAQAYGAKDTPLTQTQAIYWQAPCVECATWRAAWPYVSRMSMDGLPREPVPGDKPLLFMWGNMTRGKPREKDSLFFDETWIEFVKSTPSGRVVEVAGDHWLFHESSKLVNSQMMMWLNEVRWRILRA